MKTCDYCGEVLKGDCLKIDRSFFDEERFAVEDAVFCDEECFLEALSDTGAIWDGKVNDDEDQQ